jgi:tripartite-type tricarboxylate transporter receptor subunit TctC
MLLNRREALALTASGLAGLASSTAWANVEPFYKGKNIDLIVGYPPGGSNNLYARVLANHISKYIPGNPGVVVRNMPGAGSVTAAAHVFSQAPRDGTVLALASPTLPLEERLTTGVQRFKSSEFSWVGRINTLVNVIFTRKNSIRTFDEAFTTAARLSATGAGSAIPVYPNSTNVVLGTKFDLVRGYSGSAEGMLAVERAEVDGHCTGWDTLKTSHPQWIEDKSINILTQFSSKRIAELANVPTVVEFAKTKRQTDLMRAIVNAADIGTSFFSTPQVPADRLAALRQAFMRCMEDKDFLAEIATLKIGLDPLAGELVAGFERGAVVGHLAFVPAIAHAEQEAALGNLVQRGHLLGGLTRVALRHQAHPGAHQQRAGGRRGSGEGHERVHRVVVFLRDLAASGKARGALHRNVGVLRRPDAVEAALLQGAGQLARRHGIVGEEHRGADFHGWSPLRVLLFVNKKKQKNFIRLRRGFLGASG